MQWLFRHDGFLFWCYLLKKRRLGWLVQKTAKWVDGSDTPLCRCALVDGLERWGCSCSNEEKRRLGQWPATGLAHIFVIIWELISCLAEKGNYCFWVKILSLPSYIVAPKSTRPSGVYSLCDLCKSCDIIGWQATPPGGLCNEKFELALT